MQPGTWLISNFGSLSLSCGTDAETSAASSPIRSSKVRRYISLQEFAGRNSDNLRVWTVELHSQLRDGDAAGRDEGWFTAIESQDRVIDLALKIDGANWEASQVTTSHKAESKSPRDVDHGLKSMIPITMWAGQEISGKSLLNPPTYLFPNNSRAKFSLT
jgi:hypothetical protein